MSAQEDTTIVRKPLVIVLTKSILNEGQLRNKLDEYRRRLKVFVSEKARMDTTYKIAVLEKLILDREIAFQEMYSKIVEVHGPKFELDAFWEAWRVIEDYNITGGRNTTGGTGLHLIV